MAASRVSSKARHSAATHRASSPRYCPSFPAESATSCSRRHAEGDRVRRPFPDRDRRHSRSRSGKRHSVRGAASRHDRAAARRARVGRAQYSSQQRRMPEVRRHPHRLAPALRGPLSSTAGSLPEYRRTNCARTYDAGRTGHASSASKASRRVAPRSRARSPARMARACLRASTRRATVRSSSTRRRASDPGSFIATIVQRDFAFDDALARKQCASASSPTLGIDLTRRPVPASTSDVSHDRGHDRVAARSRLAACRRAQPPGYYDGFRLTAFQSLGGSIATVGAPSLSLAAAMAAASSARHARRRFRLRTACGTARRSQLATVVHRPVVERRHDAATRQLPLRATQRWQRVDPRERTVARRHARYGRASTHDYGVFASSPASPGVTKPINNDIQGAYYRFAYQDLRWQVDGGIDECLAISSDGFDGTSTRSTAVTRPRRASASAATRLRRQQRVHRMAGDGVYTDIELVAGREPLQFSIARNNNTPTTDAEQFQLDHAWNMPARIANVDDAHCHARRHVERATGGHGYRRLRRFDATRIGVLGRRQTSPTTCRSRQPSIQRAVARQRRRAAYTATWASTGACRRSGRWSARITTTATTRRSCFVLDPLIPVVDPLPAQRNRAVFLMLRYEARAGSPVHAPAPGRIARRRRRRQPVPRLERQRQARRRRARCRQRDSAARRAFLDAHR